MRLAIVVVCVGLAACAGARAPVWHPDDHPTRDRIGAAPLLELDVPVHGSTTDAVPNVGAICTGGGTVGKWSARPYRFVAPETATYRFDVRADYPAVLDVGMTREGPQENRGIDCKGTRKFGLRVTLRAHETYSVVIDGVMQAQGSYELVARRDTSTAARIRPEDPAIVAELVAHAPVLQPGAPRVLGTFAPVAAGARATCGGLGSGTVYALEVSAPGVVALHAITQFPAALELRDRAGHAVACARSADGAFEVALAQAVPAGSYVVVVDTTDVAPELFDALREYPVRTDAPGAGVRGGFALDLTETP